MNKTLLISEIFPPIHGGSGRWFWDLYSRLPVNDYVFVVGNSQGADEFDLKHRLDVHRMDLSSDQWGILNLNGALFYLKKFWVIRKLVKQKKIKQLHLGRCLPEGIIGLLFRFFYRIPYLCYIHGEDVETARDSREFILLIKYVLKYADLLICNSGNTQKILLEKWSVPIGKIQILYPGVDAEKFVPEAKDQFIRKELGWDSRFVVLTVGRLQKRKGHDKMIYAIDWLKKNYSIDILYAIVGDGQEKEALMNIVMSLGIEDSVSFLGEVSDQEMLQCYQQADLFILPNRQEGKDIEGFGIVLVEAQSCAIPVIAGNSGGTAETMLSGESGFIIDCTSEVDIANKVFYLFENEEVRKVMGGTGRNHVLENLDWQQILDKAKDAFKRLS
jgi:phosphatidylinositol alpha-1,6-mannosyltransferase